MAAAVLSALLPDLLEKLSVSALNELRLIRGVDKELDGLSTTLAMIQALLDDAEEKQRKDKAVQIWLTKLKDVAFDMDKLLNDYEAEKLKSKLEGQQANGWRKTKVISCLFSCSCWHRNLTQYKTAYKMKHIRERLDKIATEREILSLRVLGGTSHIESTERLQTSSLVDDSNVYGRENDRENIIKILLTTTSNSSQSKVSVLPIVGMGGLGKTTLTQLVYNDNRVKDHFQLRLWVCVSENFDVLKLTKEALGTTSAVSGFSSVVTANMNALQEDLSSNLKGKLFLLVLDDVWNEDPEKWYSFCSAFVSGEKGSKVIVTTRNENVGRIMGGLPPYQLKRLSDGDCWNLFRNCAFVDGNSGWHPSLEKIGKQIVKKLKGLPLAAKALGSLLYSKLDEEEWKEILRSEIWELPSDKNNILPALRLSYDHLPSQLKQCFAFCSVFHKDYVFSKKKLVQIWMALGYIQPQGRRRLEDIGSSYFQELLNRSFFQPHKGKYVMHDAIHDLAQSISVGECLRLEDGLKHTYPIARHVSYSCSNSGMTSFDVFREFGRLQTLLLLRGHKSLISPMSNSLFQSLSCLRVLDLNRRDIKMLPYSIGNLKQLRYLGLSGTDIEFLPPSICSLYNLQTLKLKHCNALIDIPKGITNLTNLRHMEAGTTLISWIGRIGKLTSLQELEEFTVRKSNRFTIKELKNMAELHGSLSIRSLENVANGEEASEAMLSTKSYLSVLEFIWEDDFQRSPRHEFCDQEVLEGLRPHVEVKELTIKGYAGTEFPSWIGSPTFSYLQTIHLSGCRRCNFLPPLGQLPVLKYLDIGTFGVAEIGSEFSGTSMIAGFPSLNELVISDMPDLEVWVAAEDDLSFPTLMDLEIVECPSLKELPKLPATLTRLRISEAGLSVLPLVRTDRTITSSLLSMQIHECPNLRSLESGLLGQQQLSSLMDLTITDCEQLETLPVNCFRPLTLLRRLHIYNCPNLMVDEQERGILPSSLEDLQVNSCVGLINVLLNELGELACLTNLKIAECSGLERFPNGGLPPKLKTFGISNCADLQCLPEKLQEVLSLETLIISNCPHVVILPQICLPEMLQEFYIEKCPSLMKQLENERGRENDKIAHVPYVEIDGECITRGAQKGELPVARSLR